MQRIVLFLIGNTASILFAGGAVSLAILGREGWLWFILASILCACSAKFKDPK